MIESIDHINIVVDDLTKMTTFYRDLLGLRVTKEVSISGEWIDHTVGLSGVAGDVVYLEAAQGARIELIRYRSPDGIRPSGFDKPNAKGIRHLAFRVNNI